MRPKTALGRKRNRMMLRRRLKGLFRGRGPRVALGCAAASIMAAVVLCTAGLAAAATATTANEGDPFENGDLVASRYTYKGKPVYRLNVGIKVQVTNTYQSVDDPYPYPAFLKAVGSQYGWGATKMQYKNMKLTNSRDIKMTALPTEGDCAQVGNTGPSAAHFDCWRNGTLLLVEDADGCGWNADKTVYSAIFCLLVDNDHDCTFTEGGNYDQASLGLTYVKASWKVNGDVKVRKVSAKPSVTNGDGAYSLEGAVFYVFDNKECEGTRVARMVTDDTGTATSKKLAAGTYYIKEAKAPKGFELSDTVAKVTVTAGKTATVTFSDEPQGGYAQVRKVPADAGLVAGDGRYSLAGAVYGIYGTSACSGTPLASMTTDASGAARSGKLAAGTYYIKEAKASPGFGLDAQVHAVKVGAGATASFASAEPLLPGCFDVTKVSANPSVSDGNGCYSLAGAVYGCFANAACTGNPAATVTTDDQGYGKSGAIAAGRYWVREIAPPTGFLLEDGAGAQAYPLLIGGGTTEHVNGRTVSDEPASTTGALVRKVDAETGEGASLGGASLAGAQFSIEYYDGYHDSPEAARASGAPKRQWLFQTDESGTVLLQEDYRIGGDELYMRNGQPVIPLGTLVIQESRAPEGYLLNPSPVAVQVTLGGSSADSCLYQAPAYPDSVKRGDYSLVKYKASNLGRLEGIPFRLTNLDTGEAHILVTDANGEASTAAEWNPHTQDTNGNDRAVADDGSIDESKLDPQAGLWFGQDAQGRATEPDDERGALPYGRYRVEELQVQANSHLQMASYEISIYKDGATVHGEVPNEAKKGPALQTQAHDGTTLGKDCLWAQEARIVDRVTYANLEPGVAYTLRATVMDAVSGEAAHDGNGDAIAAEKAFTPVTADGEVTVEIPFRSLGMGNGPLVVFEELLDGGADIVCSHRDLDDPAQTVQLRRPQLATTAVDGADGDKVLSAEPGMTVVDAVSYRNLQPGVAYRLQGSLMLVQEDGSTPLVDDEGNPVEAELEFTPDEPEGALQLAFPVDGLKLAGRQVVVFERLYLGDRLMAEHADAHDASQTVSFEAPAVRTAATDRSGTTKAVTAQPQAQVLDAVSLSGLSAGSTYCLDASLHRVEAGAAEPLTDAEGNPVTAQSTFTAQATEMELPMAFDIDSSQLDGADLVVFERLSKDGTVLVDHSDPLNGAQTVSVAAPTLATSARDAADGDKQVLASAHAAITDAVSCKGLTPGDAYTLCGTLYLVDDQGNVEPLGSEGDEGATATVDFTAEGTEQTVEVAFAFDGSKLEGRSVVAFEELYSGGEKIASHEDPLDSEQTVAVTGPKLGTRARDADGGEGSLPAKAKASITDTVSYSGLQPGSRYRIAGYVYDKQADTLLEQDGKPLTGAQEFKAKDTDGSVEVEIPLDASKLAGHDLVVFEYLYDLETEGGEAVPLAQHADPQSKEQTLSVASPDEEPEAPAKGSLPKTGDAGLLAAGFLAATAVMAAALLLLRRRFLRRR